MTNRNIRSCDLPSPVACVSSDWVVSGAEGDLNARLYRSKIQKSGYHRLMVFFHGGGFISGNLDEADMFLRALSASDSELLILAASYTLATTSPFPAAAEDAHAVLQWALRHKADLHWTGEQLIVSGMGAGANLATVSNIMSYDRRGPNVVAQVLIMPMIDPSLETASGRRYGQDQSYGDSCEASYRGYFRHASDRMHPYGAPLRSSRLKHLAPALIFSAEGDPLSDDAEHYADKLAASGVDTTVIRMRSTLLANVNRRIGTAYSTQVLTVISGFLSELNKLAYS